jgi:hypothetical protein
VGQRVGLEAVEKRRIVIHAGNRTRTSPAPVQKVLEHINTLKSVEMVTVEAKGSAHRIRIAVMDVTGTNTLDVQKLPETDTM